MHVGRIGMWSLAVAIGAALPGFAAAGDRTPTHVTVFDSVAAEVAQALIPANAIPPGRPLVLSVPVPGDTLSLLEGRILDVLQREGVRVRLSTGGVPNAGDPLAGTGLEGTAAAGSGVSPLRLEARVESKRVAYLRRIGRFPFGTKGFERLVALQAQSRLLDTATGEVLWTRTGAGRRDDVVRPGDVEAAASSGYGLFRPASPPRSGLRFLEPTIVAGVVVGLIVLFYSNRT